MNIARALIVAGWFVINALGDVRAGPFDLMQDCNAVAAMMARQDATIMSLCRYF